MRLGYVNQPQPACHLMLGYSRKAACTGSDVGVWNTSKSTRFINCAACLAIVERPQMELGL